MSLVPDMMPAWELREHLKQRDEQITALRAKVERLNGIEELYKAGCAAWNPVFKVVLDERDALRSEVEKWQEATINRDREIIKVCDERDALRAEVEKIKSDPAFVEYKRLKAEVEKLKAALMPFADGARRVKNPMPDFKAAEEAIYGPRSTGRTP